MVKDAHTGSLEIRLADGLLIATVFGCDGAMPKLEVIEAGTKWMRPRLPPGNRELFERLLLRRLDQHRTGAAREAKQLIGGAWRTIIDDMYKKNAERLSAEQGVVAECADAIVRLMKNLRD